jgi:hypothetical protein
MRLPDDNDHANQGQKCQLAHEERCKQWKIDSDSDCAHDGEDDNSQQRSHLNAIPGSVGHLSDRRASRSVISPRCKLPHTGFDQLLLLRREAERVTNKLNEEHGDKDGQSQDNSDANSNKHDRARP